MLPFTSCAGAEYRIKRLDNHICCRTQSPTWMDHGYPCSVLFSTKEDERGSSLHATCNGLHCSHQECRGQGKFALSLRLRRLCTIWTQGYGVVRGREARAKTLSKCAAEDWLLLTCLESFAILLAGDMASTFCSSPIPLQSRAGGC